MSEEVAKLLIPKNIINAQMTVSSITVMFMTMPDKLHVCCGKPIINIQSVDFWVADQ